MNHANLPRRPAAISILSLPSCAIARLDSPALHLFVPLRHTILLCCCCCCCQWHTDQLGNSCCGERERVLGLPLARTSDAPTLPQRPAVVCLNTSSAGYPCREPHEARHGFHVQRIAFADSEAPVNDMPTAPMSSVPYMHAYMYIVHLHDLCGTSGQYQQKRRLEEAWGLPSLERQKRSFYAAKESHLPTLSPK